MDLENFKYNLSRLKKCDQYWDEMQPADGGRICAQCNKKIVDFSGMSFTEIALYMSESREPVCGFYRPEQIRQTRLPEKLIPIAFSVSALFAADTSASAGQVPVPAEQLAIPAATGTEQQVQPEFSTLKDTLYLTGRVQYYDTIRKTFTPVSFGSVIVKNTRIGVATQADGSFRLPFAIQSDSGKLVLVFSAIDLQTQEFTVVWNGQREVDAGTITLKQYEGVTTEFWVTARRRTKLGRFWRKITKPFRRK